MSVEIVEEKISLSEETFLPPVIFEVRHCGRSVFGFLISALFFLGALAVCLTTLAIGLPILAVGFIMLASDVIGFVRSKRVDGRFALNLRQKCYLFAGVVLLALSVLTNLTDLYAEYLGLFSSAQTFVFENFTFLNNISVGEFSEHILLGAVGVSAVSMGLVYWSVNHSKHRNFPFCSVAFVSFLVNIALFLVLAFGGLSFLGIAPSNPVFETAKNTFGAGIYFGFAVCCLLFAVRSMVIFVRMRKVKNAVFKA